MLACLWLLLSLLYNLTSSQDTSLDFSIDRDTLLALGLLLMLSSLIQIIAILALKKRSRIRRLQYLRGN